MDNDQITALAREYAEEIYPNLSDKIISLRTQEIKNAERLIRFLLRSYYLVEKSKVQKTYETCLYLRDTQLTSEIDSIIRSERGMEGIRVLKSLFPEIGKEVEG